MSELRDDLLLWIDLETTGLDPQRDLILEVAMQLTDRDLVPIADPRSWVVHHDSDVLAVCLNDFTHHMHTDSGLLAEVFGPKGLDLITVADSLAYHLDNFTYPRTVRAAGSSVHFDVGFLRYQMPAVYERLHYRQLNVSSIAETSGWWYGFRFEKNRYHRAYDDLQESLAELREWRQFFKYRIAR